jgi:hypothetical protein
VLYRPAVGALGGGFKQAYYFGIEDLYEVAKLMVDELDALRQRVREAKQPNRN